MSKNTMTLLAAVPLLVACSTHYLSTTESHLSNEPSDTLIYRQMSSYGIQFTNNNSVTLFMNGQQKFDDMFKAIRQARHKIGRAHV